MSVSLVDKEDDGSSNMELAEKAKKLKLINFRGVFMRDQLNFVPTLNECGILNLNTSDQPGSHWVCWFKRGKEKYYFDSFGVTAPRELVEYLKPPIIYSTCQVQEFANTNCGQWCLYVLNALSRKRSFSDIVLDLINDDRGGKRKSKTLPK